MDQEYKVEYQKRTELETVGGNVKHVAVFDNLDDAQLWWETIYHLRALYTVLTVKPR